MESETKTPLLFNTNFYFSYNKIIDTISIWGCNQKALLKLKEDNDSKKEQKKQNSHLLL